MKLFFNKKLMAYFIKVIIGCGLYFYLFWQKRIDFGFFEHKNISLFIQLFALQAVMLVVGTLRWHRIGVHAYGMNLSLLSAVHISWVGQFFSTFLPSTIGTDLSRIFYVSKKIDMPKKKLVKVTIVERLSALLTVSICSVLGLVFYFQQFSLFTSILTIAVFLILLKLFPKRRLRQILLKKDIHLPPFSAVVLSLLIFILKAFSLFIIIYFAAGKGNINDYYICLASQFIEALRVLPANIGMGHILFDKFFTLIEDINGAQIYNMYFAIKVMFKATGLLGWLCMRKR